MRWMIPALMVAALAAVTACGDDSSSSSSGDTSSGTSAGGSGGGTTSTTTGGMGGMGQGGMNQGGMGGMGQGGAGGADCTDGGPNFGQTCATNDDCGCGICYPFGMGMRCTIPCPPNPADCPGGLGCNNQMPMVCKVQ